MKRLSSPLREAHPEINWAALAAFRNVVVHDYLGVDINIIWSVVERDVPELKASVENLLRMAP